LFAPTPSVFLGSVDPSPRSNRDALVAPWRAPVRMTQSSTTKAEDREAASD
jgi:hypothetical protein